ncbi:hypothetical protein BS47DRAFT_1342728, partial [Hydnum rufescens UP504]
INCMLSSNKKSIKLTLEEGWLVALGITSCESCAWKRLGSAIPPISGLQHFPTPSHGRLG